MGDSIAAAQAAACDNTCCQAAALSAKCLFETPAAPCIVMRMWSTQAEFWKHDQQSLFSCLLPHHAAPLPDLCCAILLLSLCCSNTPEASRCACHAVHLAASPCADFYCLLELAGPWRCCSACPAPPYRMPWTTAPASRTRPPGGGVAAIG